MIDMAAEIPTAPRSAPADRAAARLAASAPAGILVVDDHELVRLGFRALLQTHLTPAEPAPQVFEAQNLAEALALYTRNISAIGVVLLDLALPDTQGLSGLATFRKRFPGARVVVLSGTTSAGLAQGALALGASAFLSKSADLSEVLRFIRERGLFKLAGTEDPADNNAPEHLSQRQAEILDSILAGKSNREIAQITHLSEGTVKNHVSTLLLMFGMRSRAQLISALH
jgi:DNA-binding NarL/FixJ family response regulator